jgi:hypothetical protein
MHGQLEFDFVMISRSLFFASFSLIVLLFSVDAFGEAANSSRSGEIVQALTIGLPIAAGVIGYFIAYYNNWRLERRKAELKFVSDQLQYLYGPLFALSEAGRRAARSLLDRHGLKQNYFDPSRDSYSKEDIADYRLWMSEVLMPINFRIEKAIIENAHLIEGADMPDVFREILAHIATYKAVMKAWPDEPPKRQQTYDEAVDKNTASIPFPREFAGHVRKMFDELKERQIRLIGPARRKPN